MSEDFVAALKAVLPHYFGMKGPISSYELKVAARRHHQHETGIKIGIKESDKCGDEFLEGPYLGELGVQMEKNAKGVYFIFPEAESVASNAEVVEDEEKDDEVHSDSAKKRKLEDESPEEGSRKRAKINIPFSEQIVDDEKGTQVEIKSWTPPSLTSTDGKYPMGQLTTYTREGSLNILYIPPHTKKWVRLSELPSIVFKFTVTNNLYFVHRTEMKSDITINSVGLGVNAVPLFPNDVITIDGNYHRFILSTKMKQLGD